MRMEKLMKTKNKMELSTGDQDMKDARQKNDGFPDSGNGINNGRNDFSN